MTFVVFADGVDVDLLAGVDKAGRSRAAAMALNSIARSARTQAARLIRDEVNLPASYVGAGDKRLYVSQYASESKLEARITARGRPTSLARFVVGNPKVGKPGVWVEVAPGKARLMKRAFVIKLPQGTSDTKFNLGLAIRLRPGESIKNKKYGSKVSKGLFVMYGPSVAQIFRANDGSGVADDMAPGVAMALTDEFMRLLEL